MSEFGPHHIHQRLIAVGGAAKRGELAEAQRQEHELFYSTLVAIRDGQGDPKLLATLALRSTELEFERWE